jgi:cyclophilin family peptidyl-prolyl cis-trans isomerase
MRFKPVFALLTAMALAGPVAAQTPGQPAPRETSAATAAMTEAASENAVNKTQALLAVPALEPENTWHLDLSTGGRVSIQLRPDIAPNHVERIKTLTRQGFYNGLLFHRVIEGFMAQGGDPQGTGEGGSQLPDLTAEFNGLPHVRGAVSMARANDPNSANSQFFIMLAPRLTLDNKYTVFGRVVGGMNYVDTIQRGEPPVNPSRIVRASIGADNVPPPSAAEPAAATQAAPAPAAPLPAPAPQN